MTTDATDRHARTTTALLGAIAALLLTLVVGLGVAAWLVVGEAHRVEAALERQTDALATRLDKAVATTAEASHEVIARQRALATGMEAKSAATLARVRTLEARRRALAPIPASPFGKLDRGIQMSQLNADELFVLLTHMAETQAVIARGAAPLPVQKKLDAGR
jgi:Flp pilus assembly protein TadG